MNRVLKVVMLTLLTQAPLSAQQLVEQQSGASALLQAVSAVDEQVVWVSGHAGMVLLTTDGGASWTRRHVPGADSLQFRDIEALDSQRAWALTAGTGSLSTIQMTEDGGKSWTSQFQNTDPEAFYDCLAFFDERTGVAFSDATKGRTNILRTTDGGKNWSLLPPEAVPAPLEGEGAFAASGGCATAIDDRHGFMALGSPAARLLTTTDAGATWMALATPIVSGASAGLSAASFRDPMHGIVVGGDMASYRSDSSIAAVAITNDGGHSWLPGRRRPDRAGTPFGVTWVRGADESTALIASPGGLHLTRDAGSTWETLDDRNFWSVGAAGRTAWAVGVGGVILRVHFDD